MSFFTIVAMPYTTNGQVFLSSEIQVEALAQRQSAFYFCLMIQQCFNLLACKCRNTFRFGAYFMSNGGVFTGALFDAWYISGSLDSYLAVFSSCIAA
ncbi:hypothetical protein BC830DRAFT_1111212 [Chytriomyces sp. MP71]|nr:hypothetical protein BC830DRAFT_1111212 [Chytriomyces sp. MP71]